MRPEIRALIFDVDGVLADTIDIHYRAWKRLTDEAGISFTREDNDALRGISRREGVQHLMRGRPLDEATVERWMTRKSVLFLEAMTQMSSADRLPGVTELIDEARAAGLRLGVASSSRNARPVLEQIGLIDAFEAFVDALCIPRTKPAPDLFVWAAGRLGVCPAQALIFEDSQAGIEAGRVGGFWTVGIGDPHVVGAAHVVVPTLSGVTLGDLLDHLPG